MSRNQNGFAPTLSPSAPITVVREVEQVEVTTPERLIAEAAGDMDAPVRAIESEEVRATTVRALLERHATVPEAPIYVVKRVEYFEVTTPDELARDPAQALDEPLRVIRERYRVAAATVADLIRRHVPKTFGEPGLRPPFLVLLCHVVNFCRLRRTGFCRSHPAPRPGRGLRAL